jgi:hypothetical protein|mmetsp:Transcript_1289/g.2442  ORF Transcript_1289/g.2442 Transcript_1289/m.2442 type:complete len:103 (+) Transcript_1289:672-980(+)
MFPFRYKKQVFDQCILLDNENKPWCPISLSTHGDYVDARWADCDPKNCEYPGSVGQSPRPSPLIPNNPSPRGPVVTAGSVRRHPTLTTVFFGFIAALLLLTY